MESMKFLVIDDEISRELQKTLVKLGYRWARGSKKILGYVGLYIFTSANGTITYEENDTEFFENHPNRERSAEVFIEQHNSKIKVKDFSKTWCTFNEKNYKSLISHGIPDNYYDSYDERYDAHANPMGDIIFIEEDEIDTGSKTVVDEIHGVREIELIDGGFYYANEETADTTDTVNTPQDVSKVNRVEIITENGREVVYNKNKNIFYELSFQDNGETLKIFKKEEPKKWYEEDNAFPCLIVDNESNIIHCRDVCEWVELHMSLKGTFRPATKQEVLKLIKAEDGEV